MKSMKIDLVLFDEETLLAKAVILCTAKNTSEEFQGKYGHEFSVTHCFEEPASPITISCTLDGKRLYNAALRVGVHTSDDWESISLGEIHTLGFMCRELH
jgi:hypothetical protein